jgi:uncharacterized damage-inducible protein DinB
MKVIYKSTAIALTVLLASCVAFAQGGGGGSSRASGQGASTAEPTISSVLNRSLTGIEREILNAAEAIPEDKFDWSPATANIPGDFKTPEPVRTTAEQFKHIGDALEAYSSAVLGQKREASAGENGPKNVKTKQEVISFLKAEFQKAHSAIDTINQQNVVEQIPSPFGNGKTTRLAGALSMIGHSNQHYGQIIEYLRMNSIVPPESRPRQ